VMGNRPEYLEAQFAIWHAGLVAVPVNARLHRDEIAYILDHSGTSVVVTDEDHVEDIESLVDTVETLVTVVTAPSERWERLTGSSPAPMADLQAQDPAWIFYTSGTTGRPKGCIWGHRELRQLVQVDAWLVDLQAPDRILIVMPMFHVGGLVLSLSQHVRGGTAHLYRQFEPEDIIRGIERDKLTVLLLAPTMVQMLLDHPAIAGADLSSVRTILYSAAPMPSPVLRRAIEVFDGCGFVNLFGQTEICMFCLSPLQHKPNGSEAERRQLTSVGQPYPNLEARILDDDDNDCPVGVPGEIVARSGAMFRGYWNNSVATVQTLRNGWVHTGDMGRIDEDGFLYLVDRKKDMIISGGENIYSREVEETLLQHSAISEAAVIGVPDPVWGENVCAVLVLKTGASAAEQDIIRHCQSLMASYKKPKIIHFVSELPKLVTGKINKMELRNRYAQ
jgi:acyl-CoA synthetase (AMP-forming)/AMP-acid ligase II